MQSASPEELSMAGNEWPTPTETIVMKLLQSRARGAYGLEIVAASEGK
jgi:hypothetical protein